MTDTEFYIMLADPPWAGPTAKIITGPDIMVNDGVFIGGVQKSYDIKLVVDKQAKDPSEFPACDIHGPSRTLLFSQRFINALNSLGVDNIQYFDADVVYAPTGEKLAYKVANIIGIVSGLDMARSDVTMNNQGNVLGIEEMALDEEKLKNHKICRLQEDIMLIVVHRSIKDAVEEAGMTGFMFVADDEYEPGMI